ncbi:MAG: GNAT family N-acetyltransferase [Planctomycetes bacterium]|nr:GNAT family N-acetyltransferase [Planctomycetota bacterium]
MPNELRIIPAEAAHVPLVVQFIHELAEYEKLTYSVVATEELLHESLFGANPKVEAVLAYWADEPAGFALFFHNFSTFLGRPGLYLEDLFIRPAYRGKGIGQAMMRHLAKLAVERKCGRFEWWVLDWNEKAIRFYESLGAQAMSDWTVYRVTGEALTRLAAGDS